MEQKGKKMDDYQKKAKDFLKSCGATMKIEQEDVVDRFPNEAHASGLRWKYRVTIRRDGRRWTFPFYGSINDYNAGSDPSEYDVLACIQKYDPGSFENFVSEYGYDRETLSEYPRIMRIYKAVKREYANVVRMFGDVMDVLYEIN